MNKFKENWKDYNPPTIPIYFIDIEALKHMLSNGSKGVSEDVLYMMLGYFEEYEQYEKASVVHKALQSMGKVIPINRTKEEKVTKPGFPPPDDGNQWEPSENGKFWQRLVSEEDLIKYLQERNKLNEENDDLELA